ncbi:MAG TPA: Asp-tRNA(Asn)/Glu-tRNA(Gln) amidotransferase subunit GatC [Urbifossiella sp.]|nr:Asp-tRNA(Asn)/Glu-tRNA(Gln) amidotransferase subunit GatC [Urbifossiella sp.]
MSISLAEVRTVAKLARLELADADLAQLQPQLAAILSYVEQLQKLDTAGVELLAHPLPIANAFRDDQPSPSLPVDDALANAPVRLGNYFGVPAVFDKG